MQRWLWDGIFWDPQSPSRRLGMGIFHFGLDRKFPRIWNPGDRDRRFGIPKNPQWEIPIPDFWDRKSEDFYARVLRIFENLGIFVPAIFRDGDFSGMGIFSLDGKSHQRATSFYLFTIMPKSWFAEFYKIYSINYLFE